MDLSNIVVSDGADIPLTIKHIQDLFGDDGKCKDVSASASLCDTLATECRKGLAERVLATERAAYPAIIRLVYHRRLTEHLTHRVTFVRSDVRSLSYELHCRAKLINSSQLYLI